MEMAALRSSGTAVHRNADRLQSDVFIGHEERIVVVTKVGNTIIVPIPTVENQTGFVLNRFKLHIDFFRVTIFAAVDRSNYQTVIGVISDLMLRTFLGAGITSLIIA